MIVYLNNSTDPYFNLATEQYLLDNEENDVFMLWRNERSVIIGRNQNAFAEINKKFVDENGIKVVRRLTGGGAVFHDLGNVNYTFITSKEHCETLDFARFCAPVIRALREMGVPAELSGRNDILADGRKISGNAQCVYNGKVMHHGTLLFSADMSGMSGALNVDEEKIKSKGIKSVRSRVCNISEYLDNTDIVAFTENIGKYVEGDKVALSNEQIAGIAKLRDEKYSTWEWNYGHSKQYSLNYKKHYPFGTVEINLDSNNGLITDIKFQGDYFGVRDTAELENRLKGLRLEKQDILPALSDIEKYIMGSTPEIICDLIFR